MQSSGQTPSQSAVLQLREEKSIVLEAYDFLDEKRLLLAAELLRQLANYEKLSGNYESARSDAERALSSAVGRHGLHGLQVYPASDAESTAFDSVSRQFMGVTLLATQLRIENVSSASLSCNPSPEAERCRELFSELILIGAELAGVSGNLQRLSAEYRRTERRARALENVVLPELEQNLSGMSSQLEEMDQEEMIRMHQRHG